ncbi:sensor histidine kinase [Salinimicrobium oceani]|uniref:Sensor histidine kinase n=1 Tax=Salinimicrobium oceani TaxID=2722702 RepID=A0ABX1CW25_9FLAO|nr:sensor histidine kinase [Salinimicrobium oceani]NJW51952.1 sensor histidine kinase [Salinimicrobium oceani]
MIRINSLPQIEKLDKKPIDGVYEKKFDFCEKNYNHKCMGHYKSISKQNGFHVCPYGFTSFVTEINGKSTTYTSIGVKGNFERKLLRKNKNKKDDKRLFSEGEVRKIIDWESNVDANFNAKTNILRDYDKSVKVVSQKKEVLDDTLHELRKLNNILKKQAFSLKTELEKENFEFPEILMRSKNISSTTQLVSARLNAYDFTLNPEIVETNPPSRISLYRKFEKARYCLEVVTKELGINITFQGTSRALNNCYEIIDVLPFILFENAIKFSYKKSQIFCEFTESDGKLEKIIVKNRALIPKERDLKELKKKHIRSKNIEDIAGSGKGLYIASLICDYHNIDLEIKTEFTGTVEGKDLGNFIVILNVSEATID